MDDNSLISTAHTCYFGVSIHDLAKHNCDKYYINDDNRVIPMKFYKSLMYVPIKEPSQWEIDNLDRVILTSYYPWDTASINYS